MLMTPFTNKQLLAVFKSLMDATMDAELNPQCLPIMLVNARVKRPPTMAGHGSFYGLATPRAC